MFSLSLERSWKKIDLKVYIRDDVSGVDVLQSQVAGVSYMRW